MTTVFQWPYGQVNIQGSINAFFKNNISANGLPAFITGVNISYDFPIDSLTAFPMYSLFHLESFTTPIAQGGIVNGSPVQIGRRVDGILEIDCWNNVRITGGARNNSAILQLRAMRDMVEYMFNSARSTHILNIYSSTANPPNVSALVRFGEVMQDPNVNIRRIRMLVDYYYTERQSGF